MPINYETHSNVSVILRREVRDKILAEAKKNKRSLSAQIAYMLERGLEQKERQNGVEHKED